ncbi:hypothetical protein GR7B_00115 [Vibrio phage vB_VcorM_GR7B]|nr:hypothetical protein GR7B_00115 [Vibrio phage vB_VcorM_GR7B]
MKTVSITEYLYNWCKLHGYSSTLTPELNSEVISTFDTYLRQFNCGATLNTPITMITEGRLAGLGFNPSPFVHSTERKDSEWELPLSHVLCHPYLPYTQADLVCEESCKALLEVLGSHGYNMLSTETVTLSDAHEYKSENLLWLNSPVANLNHETFDEYLASLTKKRRYKVRQALNQDRYHVDIFDEYFHGNLHSYNGGGFLDIRTLQERTIELLRKSYPDYLEFEYALLQSMWAWACVVNMPKGTTQFCVVTDKETNEIISIGSFVNRFNPENKEVTAFFQANVRDKSHHNVGALMLGSMVKYYIEDSKHPVLYLDPTCRTNVSGGESIETYKRLIVNDNNTNTTICVCRENPGYLTPPLYSEKNGWELPESVVVLGDEA